MPLALSLQDDLHWWELNILTSKNLIRQSHYSITIFSDASSSGWKLIVMVKQSTVIDLREKDQCVLITSNS